MSEAWEERLTRAFPVVIAALGLVVIAPALWSGWSGDDAYYSALDGVLGADHMSLFAAMRHSFDLWFFGNGRFYPGLIVEKYLVFYFFTNLLAYKCLLVGATLLTVELFRRCTAAYTSVPVANLAALIAITLFAERGYHDSILAYNAMPQFVAIAMLGSLLVFHRGLARAGPTGGRRVAIIAIALYAVAALTYEDAYGFALLFLALARRDGRSWRDALRLCAPYLAIGFGLAAFSLAMRAVVHVPPGSLYASSLAPVAVARTAFDQIVAAFPLTYWFFDPNGIFGRSSVADFLRNAPISPFTLVAFALAGWFALKALSDDRTRARDLIAFGALLIVLAALPIAVIGKYQHELRPGWGYLPVFYEAFGVGLLLAGVALWTLRLGAARRYRIAWLVAIALVGAMTQATNVRLVYEGHVSKAARQALESELAHGLLAGIPDGATVAMPNDFDWIVYDDRGPDGISTRGLFYLDGRKRVQLVPMSSASKANVVLAYDPTTDQWSAHRTKIGH